MLRTAAFDALVAVLDEPAPVGVVLSGPPGSGKSTILSLARDELDARGRSAFLLSLDRTRDIDLGALIVNAVAESIASPTSGIPARFTVPALPMVTDPPTTGEVAEFLHAVAEHLSAPVLMLDDFEGLSMPERHARVIDELSHHLLDWHIVVSTRSNSLGPIRGLRRFRFLEVPPLTVAEASELSHRLHPDLSGPELGRTVELAQGNPFMLRLLWEGVRDSSSLLIDPSPSGFVEALIDDALKQAPHNRPKLLALLDHLALSDSPQPLAALAVAMNAPVEDLRRLVEQSSGLVLLTEGDRVALIHALIREALLTRRLFAPRFCLADLKFGTEEAETDSLLDESYVSRPGVDDFLRRHRTIVIGDRGSGKSAMFRKLCTEHGPDVTKPTAVLPLPKPQELLYRITVQDREPTSADDFRAAWLLLAAWIVAGSMPESAPRALQQTARQLRSVLTPSSASSRSNRVLHAMGNRLSGAKLTLAVGPVNLGLSGGDNSPRRSRSLLDINDFLRDYDEFLESIGSQVTIPIDRVDEAFKYERPRQQALVQGLFGAEKEIHELSNLRLAVLMRTDLFETFQIEEKNKLVTRTLVLDWSEDDWIRLLANRVFVNEQLEKVLSPLTRGTGLLRDLDLPRAIDVLFPEVLEDLPAEAWLLKSIRNGNGDLQPRLAILLLVLAVEHAEDPEAPVSDLPLFSGQALRAAMTELSRLCYTELVNDFKIAPEFVRNCRAAKLRKFGLADVQALFGAEDGPINEQVNLLERVGFLERVADQKDPSTGSSFRIPTLYTRSWGSP